MGNLPKVTLLRPGWADWTVVMGKRRFTLHGGIPVPMPVAAALRLMRKKDEKGKPLFRIEGLEPQVVESAKPKPKSAEKPQPRSSAFNQMELAACLS